MKVHELFSDITKWCRGALARQSDNDGCDPGDQDAVKWCAIGGIQKCYDNATCRREAVIALGSAIAVETGQTPPNTYYEAETIIVQWNDDIVRNPVEVVEMFKKENI